MIERGQNRVYRGIFKKHYGDGPYTCSICGEQMDTLEVVHHADEDVSNNAIGNLESAHTTCHNRLHHVGLTHTDETKSRIRESMRRAVAEGRVSVPRMFGADNHFYGNGFVGEDNPFFGKKHSEETRAKMRAAWERRRK